MLVIDHLGSYFGSRVLLYLNAHCFEIWLAEKKFVIT